MTAKSPADHLAEQVSELKQVNDRYKLLLNSLSDGWVVHDHEAKIVEFNQRALEILELSENELLGKTPTDPRWKMIKEDGSDFPDSDNPALKTISTHQPVMGTIMGIEAGDDVLKWIKINSSPFETPQGTHAIVTFIDITHEYLNSILLQSISEVRKSFIDNVSQSEPDKNTDFIQSCMNAALRVTQSTCGLLAEPADQDTASATLKCLLTPHSALSAQGPTFNQCQSILEAAAQTKQPLFINSRAELADRYGLDQVNSFLAIPIYHNKELILVIGLANRKWGYNQSLIHETKPLMDTISEVLGEQKLVSERELTQIQTGLILQASGVAIWKYNIQTKELMWDDSMYVLYGIRREDFSGDYNAWEATLHPEDAEEASRGVANAIDEVRDFDTVFRIITPDEQVKYIRAKAVIFKDHHGQPSIMLGTNWDVTDDNKYQNLLLEAKENAEKYAAAKSMFMAKMSHEIRTPMNGIIGMTALLNQTDLNAEQRKMVTAVKSCGDSLLNIINDILDYSAIEAGKIKVNLLSFDVRESVDRIVSIFASVASAKGISVSTKVAPEVPQFIISDMDRIRQIISNFLNNAIKFSHNHGRVKLDVSATNNNDDKVKLCFSVSDEGIGMTQDELSNIFQDFSQGDDSIARNYGGTGLGLSISSKIAELLNGTIQVESEKGKGSTFTFMLEATKGSKKSVIEEEEADALLSHTHPHTILLAEDNNVNQIVAVRTLEKLGYQCDVAENGAQAVEQFKNGDYSLVFMDLQMPEMDGLTATEMILQHEPQATIIAMTANVLQEDRQKCLEVGMKGFLGKPILLKDIANMIKQLSTKPSAS